MAHILWHIKVEDYDTWKAVFDGDPLERGANGSKGGFVFQNSRDANEVMILLEWDDTKLDTLRQLTESPEMEEVQKRSGYTETPDVYVLKVADKVAA